MNIKSQFEVSANVGLYELPLETKYNDWKWPFSPGFPTSTELYQNRFLIDKGKNLVVDMGLFQVLALMIGSSTASFSYCGVGSGTSTPIAGQTTLDTEIGRNPILFKSRTGLTAYFDTTFGENDKNGTWNETALFNSSSGGDMLCRRKFPTTFTKNTSKAAVVSWTITISAVADA